MKSLIMLLIFICIIFFELRYLLINMDYVDYYIIPEGYTGFLIVRQIPSTKPRPKKAVYDFDIAGSCIVNFVTTGWVTSYFIYKGKNHKRKIPNGDSSMCHSKDKIYGWSPCTTGLATSPIYNGEIWHIAFVGNINDFEDARKNVDYFIQKFDLYKQN